MKKQQTYISLLFLLPALLLILIFFVYPLFTTLSMSFQKLHVTGGREFVGLDNYVQAFQNREFWLSLSNTIVYTLIVTPMIFLLAVLLAAMLKTTSISTKCFRTIFFIPVAISFVVGSYIWKWIYNDTYGILNYLLSSAGLIQSPINWLGDTWIARIMVSIMITWKTQGFSMMILLAGLQAIPESLYEAAKIDGAGKRESFRHITLPMLRPTLVLALVVSIAGSFKAFDHFYIMTAGGPLRTTQTIVMYLNKLAFEYFELGAGAAVSVIFLVLLLSLSGLQLKLGGHVNE